MKTENFEIIVKTFQGLEDVLAQEIIAIGGEEVEQGKRMVSFVGNQELLYKANLHLRTALRVLKPIKTFSASNTDEVYDFMKTIEWEKYLNEDQTFSIDSVVFSDNFRHSKFVTYRAKDAIADYFQEKFGKRPSVRINNADLALNLHIAGITCTLSLDSSGESLHKRGYRVAQTEAPLNEVLAAGMILKTGWNGNCNFIDPMCGSGTLLIEAALIATNTPPGIYRQGFAFEKWKDFDQELFDKLYNDESDERDFEYKIYGSDISPKAIEIAKENVRSAGMSRYIDLQVKPFQQYSSAPEDGMMITNPPYGERISSRDLLSLYEMIGSSLKHVFKGYDAWILSYREECFEKIGLKPSLKFELMNGGLDCEFRKYEIFSGKMKEFKSKGGELNKDEAYHDIPETDNHFKKILRKERTENNGDRRKRLRNDEMKAGGNRPRRENTFKKDAFENRREKKYADKKNFSDKFSSDKDEKRVFGKERRPFGEEKKGFGKERRPFGEEKRRRDYSESGNFRRNAEGKLELRTDGEFKPRGERTFNPNRPMFIPGRDNIQKKDSDEKTNE